MWNFIQKIIDLGYSIIKAERNGDTSVSHTFQDVDPDQVDAIVGGIQDTDPKYKVSYEYNSLDQTLRVEIRW